MATEPTIIQLARRLLLEVEQAVRGFARYHKYHVGARLREQTLQVAVVANRAWRDRPRQLQWTQQLAWDVDGVKILLQLAADANALSGAQLQLLGRTTRELGKQVGGWLKQQQRDAKGQSAAPVDPAPQRALILSAGTASPVEAMR